DDTTLGARLVCGAYPIFVGRGELERGKALYTWAATVVDVLLQSKVLVCGSALEVALSRRDGSLERLARLSLHVAGDLPLPWRARAHAMLALSLLVIDEARAQREIARGYAALEEPGAIADDRWLLDLWVADLHLWRRDYDAAVDASARFSTFSTQRSGYLLLQMNLNGCALLAAILAGDSSLVEQHLASPTANEHRAAILAAVRRGEVWLLSYEAIRAAALGYLGEVDRGRRDLAAAYGLLDGRSMQDVDADFLAGFGWLSLCAGEADQTRAILGDTWSGARSPNTLTLVMEAYERSHGIADSTFDSRLVELAERAGIRELINREGRGRLAVETELHRLGL
ncbi:MAG: hypothetical protein ABI927_09140, partial [Gaiellaceae bacterium]